MLPSRLVALLSQTLLLLPNLTHQTNAQLKNQEAKQSVMGPYQLSWAHHRCQTLPHS